MRDETLYRADFDAQKVRRRQTLPVSLQKRRPSGVCVALESRFDPVLLQYAGNAAVPSQKHVRRDEGFKLVQHLAPECSRFSRKSAALGVGETKPLPTQALLQHSVLFLEILDHIKLMAVDPSCEHHKE